MPQDIKTTSGKMRSIDPLESMDIPMGMTPCFEVEMDNLPEAKDWTVGDEYSVELTVNLKAVRARGDDVVVELEVTGIKAL